MRFHTCQSKQGRQVCENSFSKGMLVGVGTNVQEPITHLDHATTIPLRRGKENDKSVADPVTAVQYNEKES